MKQLVIFCFLLVGSVLISNIKVNAQDLVYSPINPSFIGGNSFNASWLLSQAQAQDKFGDARDAARLTRDPLAEFKDNLSRQLLNQLSRQLVGTTFGTDGLEEGRYDLGDFSIEIFSGPDGLTIIIFDNLTGAETTIIVPYI